jgi:hypothetical protein
MALTDPDARNRRIGSVVEPVAWVLALLAVGTAPFLVAIILAQPANAQILAWVICMFSYIGGNVLFGLILYYSASHRNPLGIVAFVLAYVAGLILILGAGRDPHTHLPDALIPALVVWAGAAVLLVIYIVHAVSARETLANGVNTTAVVTSAGINGMVNYMSHWKLTLKFTDQDGNERWFHVGRTGVQYRVGQEFTIRYNPKRPGSKRSIVLLNG